MTRPFFLSVSGNICSGKSTVAKLISKGFGWMYLPYTRPELKYLDDLFRDPERWSFETQVSFLASKADNIRWALDSGKDSVLDRSIYEDVAVFARYFHETERMDDRAFATYCDVATHFLTTFPPPDLLLYCSCGPDACLERLTYRAPRSYEIRYSPDQLHRLAQLYNDWIGGFNHCAMMAIDTETNDFREENVAKMLLSEVASVVRRLRGPSPYQLELFEDIKSSMRDTPLALLEPVNDNAVRIVRKDGGLWLTPEPLKDVSLAKIVYIAAPFTEQAIFYPERNGEVYAAQRILLEHDPIHGAIPSGNYRKALLSICKAFDKLGFQPFLPHRDINKWGRKILPAHEVVQSCTDAVIRADLLFAILGCSLGAHFEAGLAASLRKPMLIAKVGDMDNSFFADGILALPHVHLIKSNTIENIVERLVTEEVGPFLHEFGLL